jgi:chromosome segregation protein
VKFTRLRVLGFKSFVEPTEFLIEPGLTGVVGPNGWANRTSSTRSAG